MKEKEEKLEKVIEKALELLDEGKTIPEILNSFPQFEEELREIFKIIDVLSKEKIIPQKEILEKIIAQIETEKPVTNKESLRYIDREAILKGPTPLINSIKNLFIMAERWKIVVPLGVLAIVAVLVVLTQLPKGTPVTPVTTEEKPPVVTKEKLLPPTGNVDDIVSAILSEASFEFSQTEKDMQDDISLLDLDSQALNDFAQAYNENEF